MKITIKLFATLRTNRFKAETREYQKKVTINQVAEDLMIPREEMALILVNGHTAPLDFELKNGDTLSIFPPVGGG